MVLLLHPLTLLLLPAVLETKKSVKTEYGYDYLDEDYYSDELMEEEFIPEFVTQPTEYVIEEAGSAKLECEVKDLGPTTISWRRVEGNDTGDPSYIAVGPTLLLTDPRFQVSVSQYGSVLSLILAKPEDRGQYQCQVFSHPPVFLTHSLQIKTAPSVSIIGKPSSGVLVVEEGQELSLVCQGDGYPAPNIFWRRKKKRLTDDRFKIQADQLIFTRASREQSGEYVCIAENGNAPQAEDTLEVKVTYKPEVYLEANYIHHKDRTELELICHIQASPAAKVVWRGLESVEHGNISSTTRRNGKHVLVLGSLALVPKSDIVCEAQNDLGTASALFNTNGKPVGKSSSSEEIRPTNGMEIRARVVAVTTTTTTTTTKPVLEQNRQAAAKRPVFSSEETEKRPFSSEELEQRPFSSEEIEKRSFSSEEIEKRPFSSEEKPLFSSEEKDKIFVRNERIDAKFSSEETTKFSSEETKKKELSSEEVDESRAPLITNQFRRQKKRGRTWSDEVEAEDDDISASKETEDISESTDDVVRQGGVREAAPGHVVRPLVLQVGSARAMPWHIPQPYTTQPQQLQQHMQNQTKPATAETSWVDAHNSATTRSTAETYWVDTHNSATTTATNAASAIDSGDKQTSTLGEWVRAMTAGLKRLEAAQAATHQGVGRLEAQLTNMLSQQEAVIKTLARDHETVMAAVRRRSNSVPTTIT